MKTEHIMTHKGTLRGRDARHPNYASVILLRETKTLWVDRLGHKYRKADGLPTGSYRDRFSSFPPFKLDLKTIHPVDQP